MEYIIYLFLFNENIILLPGQQRNNYNKDT